MRAFTLAYLLSRTFAHLRAAAAGASALGQRQLLEGEHCERPAHERPSERRGCLGGDAYRSCATRSQAAAARTWNEGRRRLADDEGKLIDARCRRKITGHPENAQASHWSTHLVSDFLAHFTYLPEDVRVLSIRSGVLYPPGMDQGSVAAAPKATTRSQPDGRQLSYGGLG